MHAQSNAQLDGAFDYLTKVGGTDVDPTALEAAAGVGIVVGCQGRRDGQGGCQGEGGGIGDQGGREEAGRVPGGGVPGRGCQGGVSGREEAREGVHL